MIEHKYYPESGWQFKWYWFVFIICLASYFIYDLVKQQRIIKMIPANMAYKINLINSLVNVSMALDNVIKEPYCKNTGYIEQFEEMKGQIDNIIKYLL